jgi:uncharacterized integral membrane protein
VTYPASGDAPERAGNGEPAPLIDPAATESRAHSSQAPASPETARRAGEKGKIPHTRTALAYNSLIAGAIVLILLLVFILENTESVKITYFGAGFHLPLGVALLLAAIGGALLVGIVGTARIVQLRRHVRRRP